MSTGIGTPVAVFGITSNAHDGQPGLVSAVWGKPNEQGGVCCNVVVFPDCPLNNQPALPNVLDKTSIYVFATAEQAADAEQSGRGSVYGVLCDPRGLFQPVQEPAKIAGEAQQQAAPAE